MSAPEDGYLRTMDVKCSIVPNTKSAPQTTVTIRSGAGRRRRSILSVNNNKVNPPAKKNTLSIVSFKGCSDLRPNV